MNGVHDTEVEKQVIQLVQKLFYDPRIPLKSTNVLAVTLREVQGGGHEVVLASGVYLRDLKNSLSVWISSFYRLSFLTPPLASFGLAEFCAQ